MKHQNAKKFGYTIKDAVLDYKNPYMEIYKYNVELPTRKHHTYWALEGGDFAVVIPIFPDNTTILVGQYRPQADYFSWEFTMGFVENVSALENAKTELREETGYTAKEWFHIGSYFVGPGLTNRKANIFVAKELTAGATDREEAEILQVSKVPLSEVKEMIDAGFIVDGPSIVAFHYLEKFLGKK